MNELFVLAVFFCNVKGATLGEEPMCIDARVQTESCVDSMADLRGSVPDNLEVVRMSCIRVPPNHPEPEPEKDDDEPDAKT